MKNDRNSALGKPIGERVTFAVAQTDVENGAIGLAGAAIFQRTLDFRERANRLKSGGVEFVHHVQSDEKFVFRDKYYSRHFRPPAKLE